MEETRGTRINVERGRQALATGAETVVTECPFCLTMVRDGLAELGQVPGSGVAPMDIAEVLAASVRGRALPVVSGGAGGGPPS